MIDVLTQIQLRERPFNIARKADVQQLTNLLIGEHPSDGRFDSMLHAAR